MHCPKCGNQVDLFADKCLKCGMNFKSYSIAQRKKLFNKSNNPNIVHKSGNKKRKPKSFDSSNVNGYMVEEGRSINGGKLKKGSHTSRDGSRFAGHDTNNAVRKAWYNG